MALLAFLAAPAQVYPITAPEAASAVATQIRRQVRVRLHGGYSGETNCAGVSETQQEVTAITQLAQWRCKLVLRGVHFPRPCKVEANVFATGQPNHPRIQWLYETKSCHEGRARWRLSNRRL
jgi:hypothetical protein